MPSTPEYAISRLEITSFESIFRDLFSHMCDVHEGLTDELKDEFPDLGELIGELLGNSFDCGYEDTGDDYVTILLNSTTPEQVREYLDGVFTLSKFNLLFNIYSVNISTDYDNDAILTFCDEGGYTRFTLVVTDNDVDTGSIDPDSYRSEDEDEDEDEDEEELSSEIDIEDGFSELFDPLVPAPTHVEVEKYAKTETLPTYQERVDELKMELAVDFADTFAKVFKIPYNME
jgi:hypothetical protein